MSLLDPICRASAAVSLDEVYRYELVRPVASFLGTGMVGWIMLNPSTADATTNDPTIRKCLGFSQRWGFERIQVVNLFAYRATKPADLRKALEEGKNVVGEQNRKFILKLIRDADLVVCAWGNDGIFKASFAQNVRSDVLDWVRRYSKRACHLGLTRDGNPKHPLMLEYHTPLVPLL